MPLAREGADSCHETLNGPPSHRGEFTGCKIECKDLLELDAGVQPRAIRPKNQLVRAGTGDGLCEQVPPTHPRRVGEHVGMTFEVVDQGKLGAPVVREGSEMRDDERDVWILGRDHLDGSDLPHHVVEHRKPIRSGCFADLAAYWRVVPMNLEPSEAIPRDGLAHHRVDSTVILACNSSAERILGLTADQMKGRTSMDPRWRAIRDDGSPFPGEDHPAMVTLRTGEPSSGVIMGVHRPDGELTWILINSRPLHDPGETEPRAAVATFAEITQLRELQEEKERLAAELHRALTKALSAFLPICANCKSIRRPDRTWVGLEDCILAETGTEFTHTVCPTCAAELYPGMELEEG